MKEFNTAAICIPKKHYMVDITDKVNEIKKMVDAGKYFTINRARQYGKTTMLNALSCVLSPDHYVLNLDFQAISDAGFRTEEAFVKAFSRNLIKKAKLSGIPSGIVSELKEIADRKENEAVLDELFFVLTEWCEGSDKPIVMLIDEVDSATNNQVFLDFLAQLRLQYIEREKDSEYKTFKSVILVGVTDVKHLKSKIRPKDEHKVNSPWNIAADFDVDMSLSEAGIKGMLDEYEADHNTGMDTARIAELIHDYTSGYPYLVSRICELMDKEVSKTLSPAETWTRNGIDEAVKLILMENNTLFQSVIGKLTNYPEMSASIRSILMEGAKLPYNPQHEAIEQMQMYGLIRNDNGIVRVSNRIFETVLYNLYLYGEELEDNVFSREGGLGRNRFVEGGVLNMRLIMERFIETYTQVYGPLREKFKEKDGRELFLLYLKPIINGTGNYYIEAQTRDLRRTDVIVDYLGKQYIIELKIWRGERYNAEGEKQISDYLDYFGLTTGYMLSFNFNKNKESGVKRINIGDKVLYEGTV